MISLEIKPPMDTLCEEKGKDSGGTYKMEVGLVRLEGEYYNVSFERYVPWQKSVAILLQLDYVEDIEIPNHAQIDASCIE